jgi:ketosteroid isomerase-like protein
MMSAQDVETISEGVAALKRGDLDGMMAALDPDVELVTLKSVLDGSEYRGHEGLRRWLADMREDWTEWELALDEVQEVAPDRILVKAHMSLRGQSGVALDQPAAWLCQMRAGRATKIQFFADPAAALKAAQVSP